MFELGKVYKAKIETSPGEIAFGRATILERSSTQIAIQVRTSRDLNALFPKGTRIWFVSDSPDNTFNGLWASSVIGSQLIGGKTTMLCATPRLEPLLQRRRTPRVALDVPVKIFVQAEEFKSEVRSKDISRSGIALESSQPLPEQAQPGSHIKIVVRSMHGDITAEARVIRVENNWLVNKTTLGLEYTKIEPESIERLDKLLVLLGGKPRNPDLEDPDQTQTQKTGLASVMPASGAASKKFVGVAEVGASENQVDANQQIATESQSDG